MQPIKNWNNVKAPSEYEAIPAGGYIAKILGAEVKDYTWGKVLNVAFDITEGEYAGHYMKQYRSQQKEPKKFKGVLRQFLPKEDGTEKDEWTKSSFKGMTTAIEESNSGYKWDWNEAGLKGKSTGVLLRNEEWKFEDKHGWKAQPFKFISTNSIREGKFTIPKDKPLPLKDESEEPPTGFYPVDESLEDDDLPF